MAWPHRPERGGGYDAYPPSTAPAGLTRYHMQHKIGEGMYGVVYKAVDRCTNESVAIKRVLLDHDEGVPCTAMREISLLKDSRCEFIVRLLDIIVQDGALWLIFEHLECDLHHFLAASQQGLPLATVRPLMYQLLLAVSHCHANRVFHRDIKPHNILMQRGAHNPSGMVEGAGERAWTLKLADFGLARVFNLPLRPYTHEVVTLWYRAPEILLGIKSYSWAVDIWSVACMLAEMLNGRPLFPGDSEIDQLLKIFRVMGTPRVESWPGVTTLPDWKDCFPKWQPQPLEGVVPALDADFTGLDLLGRMLQYDPDRRITAREALEHPFFDALDKTQFASERE